MCSPLQKVRPLEEVNAHDEGNERAEVPQKGPSAPVPLKNPKDGIPKRFPATKWFEKGPLQRNASSGFFECLEHCDRLSCDENSGDDDDDDDDDALI